LTYFEMIFMMAIRVPSSSFYESFIIAAIFCLGGEDMVQNTIIYLISLLAVKGLLKQWKTCEKSMLCCLNAGRRI